MVKNLPATQELLRLLSCFSCVQHSVTPQTAAQQAPPSLGFSRQEHWGGLPFCSPMRESEVAQSCPTLSDPAAYQAPLPWDFPGKSTGVGCHCLLRQWLPNASQTSMWFESPWNPLTVQILFRWLWILHFFHFSCLRLAAGPWPKSHDPSCLASSPCPLDFTHTPVRMNHLLFHKQMLRFLPYASLSSIP